MTTPLISLFQNLSVWICLSRDYMTEGRMGLVQTIEPYTKKIQQCKTSERVVLLSNQIAYQTGPTQNSSADRKGAHLSELLRDGYGNGPADQSSCSNTD